MVCVYDSSASDALIRAKTLCWSRSDGSTSPSVDRGLGELHTPVVCLYCWFPDSVCVMFNGPLLDAVWAWDRMRPGSSAVLVAREIERQRQAATQRQRTRSTPALTR